MTSSPQEIEEMNWTMCRRETTRGRELRRCTSWTLSSPKTSARLQRVGTSARIDGWSTVSFSFEWRVMTFAFTVTDVYERVRSNGVFLTFLTSSVWHVRIDLQRCRDSRDVRDFSRGTTSPSCLVHRPSLLWGVRFYFILFYYNWDTHHRSICDRIYYSFSYYNDVDWSRSVIRRNLRSKFMREDGTPLPSKKYYDMVCFLGTTIVMNFYFCTFKVRQPSSSSSHHINIINVSLSYITHHHHLQHHTWSWRQRQLAQLDYSLHVWSSLYFCGHILTLSALLLALVVGPPRRSRQNPTDTPAKIRKD